MNVIIVGCGRVGSRLANRLVKGGHTVTVLDVNRDEFLRLDPNFTGRTVHGSGLDSEVLARAGAASADVLVAVTGGDNRNLMAVQMVKFHFNVKRAIARLHDPVRSAKFRELGVETLCTTTVLEGLLEVYVNQGEFPPLPDEIQVAGDASELEEAL